MKKNEVVRILISIFIVYHLIAVMLYPNPFSILSRDFSGLFNSYGNLLALNTTWQFFSPNPGAIKYINYDVIKEQDADFNISTFQFPPQDDKHLWKDNKGRLFYFTVRMISSSQNMSQFLIPFLCRKHSDADSIVIKAIEKNIPNIESAKMGAETEDNMNLPEQEYSCERERET
jgi:hypothetical protein